MLSLLVAPFLPADVDSQDVEAARQDGLDRIEHVAYAAAGQERPATLMVDGREVLLETALQEALIFDEHKHPRWPKGSPGGLGGQFMGVGEFMHLDGHDWEIAHVIGGNVIAYSASGKYGDVETRAFPITKVDGQATVAGAVPMPAKEIKGGKHGSNVTIVDPYVDFASHDPSLAIPAGSAITEAEWARFGRVDQENYIALQAKFGKHQAGKAKQLLDKTYKAYDTATQDMVTSAYSSQYGSSSGFTLSLTGVFHHLTGKTKHDIDAAFKKRAKARALQAEHKALVQWDLYNRTHSPDLATFHKDHDHGAMWWQQSIIDGSTPVFSGLSQSFCYRRNFFGTTCLATPLAIRCVAMSTASAQPIPGSTKFPSELEVSVAEQMKIDARSLAFEPEQLEGGSQNLVKWLENTTSSPRGGWVIDELQDAVKNGKMLPIPPAAPNVQMDSATKTWVDPPVSALAAVKKGGVIDASKLPEIAGSQYAPGAMPKGLPYAHVTDDGLPEPRVALEAGYEPGDFMIGLKGTLYWVGPDPGAGGFGLRYHKIVIGSDGKPVFTGDSWTFEGGGKNKYYRLAANVAPEVVHEKEGVTFDPNAYVVGTTETFVADLKPGDAFKVNGHPYEITGQPGSGVSKVKIKSLDTGQPGTINTDYKTLVMTKKDGYVMADDASMEQQPAAPAAQFTPGVMFVKPEGEGFAAFRVTSVLKDGTVRAKPYAGGPVEKFQPSDLVDLGVVPVDPGAWEQGDKVKGSHLVEGSLFQVGKGHAVQPARVLEVKGGKVRWVNVKTGSVGTTGAGRTYTLLMPASKPGEVDMPGTVDHTGSEPPVFDSSQWVPDRSASLLLRDSEVGQVVLTGQGAVFKVVKQSNVSPSGKWVTTVTVLSAPDKPAGAELALVGSDEHPVLVQPLMKNDAGQVAAAFDIAGWDAATDAKPITEFGAGEKFLSPTGIPYEVVKEPSGAKHVVAMNLLSGKPYPVLATKSMLPLTKKMGFVPYDVAQPGDKVVLSSLPAHTQFVSADVGPDVMEVVEPVVSEENGKVAQVGPYGLRSVAFQAGYPDEMVTLWAKPEDAEQLTINDAGEIIPASNATKVLGGLQPGDEVVYGGNAAVGKVVSAAHDELVLSTPNGYEAVSPLVVTTTKMMGLKVGDKLATPAGEGNVVALLPAVTGSPSRATVMLGDGSMQTFKVNDVSAMKLPTPMVDNVNELALARLTPGDRVRFSKSEVLVVTGHRMKEGGEHEVSLRSGSGNVAWVSANAVPSQVSAMPPAPKALAVDSTPAWAVPKQMVVSKASPGGKPLAIKSVSGNALTLGEPGVVGGPTFVVPYDQVASLPGQLEGKVEVAAPLGGKLASWGDMGALPPVGSSVTVGSEPGGMVMTVVGVSKQPGWPTTVEVSQGKALPTEKYGLDMLWPNKGATWVQTPVGDSELQDGSSVFLSNEKFMVKEADPLGDGSAVRLVSIDNKEVLAVKSQLAHWVLVEPAAPVPDDDEDYSDPVWESQPVVPKPSPSVVPHVVGELVSQSELDELPLGSKVRVVNGPWGQQGLGSAWVKVKGDTMGGGPAVGWLPESKPDWAVMDASVMSSSDWELVSKPVEQIDLNPEDVWLKVDHAALSDAPTGTEILDQYGTVWVKNPTPKVWTSKKDGVHVPQVDLPGDSFEMANPAVGTMAEMDQPGGPVVGDMVQPGELAALRTGTEMTASDGSTWAKQPSGSWVAVDDGGAGSDYGGESYPAADLPGLMWELSYVPEGQPAPTVGPSTPVGDVVSFDGLAALPFGTEVLDEDGTGWTKMAGLEGKDFWVNNDNQQVKLMGMPGESWEVVFAPDTEKVETLPKVGEVWTGKASDAKYEVVEVTEGGTVVLSHVDGGGYTSVSVGVLRQGYFPPSPDVVDPPWNSLTAQLVKLDGSSVPPIQYGTPPKGQVAGPLPPANTVWPYKSQYGTGGKVKYLDPSECDDGDIIRDKTGSRFQVIDAKNRVILPVPIDTTQWLSDNELLHGAKFASAPLVMPEGMQVRFRRVAKSIPF